MERRTLAYTSLERGVRFQGKDSLRKRLKGKRTKVYVHKVHTRGLEEKRIRPKE